MKKRLFLFITIVTFTFTSLCFAEETVKMFNFKFGEVTDSNGNIEVVNETKELRLITKKDEKSGDAIYWFGYTFDYEAINSNAVFKLIIELPQKPQEMEFRDVDAVETKETESGATEIEITDLLKKGKGKYVYKFCFTEGDPEGEWRFNFYLENKLIKVIDANVKKE